jgi:hypothetical protein
MTTQTQYFFVSTLLLLETLALPAFAQTSAPANSNVTIATPDSQPAADPPARKRGFQIPPIGVNVHAFMPSDSKTRNRFGNSWITVGPGIGKIDRPSAAGRLAFDFSMTSKESGDDHVFFAPIGISYRKAINPLGVTNDSPFIPYYGFSADLVAVDMHTKEENIDSGLRMTAGGSIVLGTTLGKSGFVEGKYIAMGKVQGYNLSGFNLTLGIRF